MLSSTKYFQSGICSGWTINEYPAIANTSTLADIFIETSSLKKVLTLDSNISPMSKKEIKDEISKVLDQFSDKALSELLKFLKELDAKTSADIVSNASLNKILREDKELLAKLAQ